MKRTFEGKIRIGFILVAVLLAVALAVAHFNFTQLNAAHALVKHTEVVKEGMQELLATISELQSGLRGYLLSGYAKPLQTYNAAVARLPNELRDVRELTKDNPVQQAHLDELDKSIAVFLTTRTQVIETARTEGIPSALKIAVTPESEMMVEGMRANIQAMIAEEDRLLSIRERASVTKDWISRGTFGVLAALILAVLISGASLIRLQIEERRQREQLEQRARLFAESVVQTLREPLLVLSTDLRVRLANRSFCRVFQCQPGQIEGYTIFEANNGQWNMPQMQTLLKETLPASTAVHDFELRHDFPGLGPRVMLLTIRRIDAPGIEAGLLLLAIEDISERKQAEGNLQKLNEDLRRRGNELAAINHELESFSYSVSHDLRAPVRHILGFTGLVRAEAEKSLSPQGIRFLGNVQKAAEQMGTLVDELLAFSRMGRQEMRHDKLNTNQLIDELIKHEFQPDLQNRTIEWQIRELPLVAGDTSMLRQVWANLISNAIKYTRHQPQASVEIGTQAGEPGEVVFFIRDNGTGFDMSYQDKLFGVFQRLHRPEEFEGTGIGLAIVRRIIDRHGGRTWAEGKIGKGACFYVALPSISD